MNYHNARKVLIALFVGSLVVQICAVVTAYSKEVIADNDLVNILLRLLAVYGVHLTVMIGGIIAQQQDEKGKPQPKKDVSTAFWVAVGLTSLWNLLLVWRSVKFGMGAFDENSEDNVELLTNYIDKIAAGGSFLVAGFLSFFFAKRD
jgi:hypothetical protein